MKKRIIAFITVLALCLSVLCIPASAATTTVKKVIDGTQRTIVCNLYRTYSNVTASMSGAGTSKVSLQGTCTQELSVGANSYTVTIKGSGTGSCSDSVGPIYSTAAITSAHVLYYAGAKGEIVAEMSA